MTEEQNKNGEEKVTLIITVLGAIFFGFLLPLIVWFVKRDSFSSYADSIAKGTLNFQLTIFIAEIICGLLSFVGIGCILLPLVHIVNIVVLVMAAVAVNSWTDFKYPMTIPFIR